MKFVYLGLLVLAGCSGGSDQTCSASDDAGMPAQEAGPSKELVCADNFCGNIVDKSTGITANCGSCYGHSQCGDNGVANACGSACLPTVAPDGDGGLYTVSPACTYYFGPGWWAGYAANGLQFPANCNYANPNGCALINNPVPADGECGNNVCGNWYCCLDDPDAGYVPLLDGSVANNDGGLP